jgi:hypothetical protein
MDDKAPEKKPLDLAIQGLNPPFEEVEETRGASGKPVCLRPV